MSLTRQAGPSLAVGFFTGLAAAAAMVAAFVGLYFVFRAVDTTSRETQVALALTMTLVPVLAALVVFITSLSLMKGWVGVSLFVGVLMMGLTIAFMAPLASGVNDCEFDVSFPLPGYGDTCD
jgi:hypothetical protein